MQTMPSVDRDNDCGAGSEAPCGMCGGAGRKIAVWLSDGFSLVAMERFIRLSKGISRSVDFDVALISGCNAIVRSSSGIRVLAHAADQYAGEIECVFTLDGLIVESRDEHPLFQWLKKKGWSNIALTRMRSVEEVNGRFETCLIEQLDRKKCSTCEFCADGMCALAAAMVEDGCVEARGGLPDQVDVRRVSSGPCRTDAMELDLDVLLDRTQSGASSLMRDIAQWLRDHCVEPVSISAIAAKFSMSERNFLRRFRRELGMKPSEFLSRIRLARAADLLINTDLPVDKVARRTGFRRGDQLTRLFRSYLSMAPSEYRQAWKCLRPH